MKIREVKAVPRKYSAGASEVIHEFLTSDMKAAEVEWGDMYASASSCAGAFAKKIASCDEFKGVIGVAKRKSSVYIYRVGEMEVDE